MWKNQSNDEDAWNRRTPNRFRNNNVPSGMSQEGKLKAPFKRNEKFDRRPQASFRAENGNGLKRMSGNRFGPQVRPRHDRRYTLNRVHNKTETKPIGRRSQTRLNSQRLVQSQGIDKDRNLRQRRVGTRGQDTQNKKGHGVNNLKTKRAARHNDNARGNMHRQNVSFTADMRARSSNEGSEKLDYRNNIDLQKNKKRLLPRIISDEIIKEPVRKKRETQYSRPEEARLEKIVFGDPSDIIDKLPSEAVPEYLDQDTSDAADGDNTEDGSEDEESGDEDNLSDTYKDRHVAWVDEDDIKYTVEKAIKTQKSKIPEGWTETHYAEMLENRYKKHVGTPKWAEFNDGSRKDTDELEDEILKHSYHIGKSTEKSLPKELIELKAMSLLNKQTHNEGPIISSMEFHPSSTVGLVAGTSGILSIFQVDGIENNKLHSMQYKKFPISKAKFLREGTEILSGSQYFPHCHCYNLFSGKTYKIPLPHGVTAMKKYEISPDGKLIALCGRFGEVHLLTTSSKELIGQLKMNARCRTLAFSPDGKTLITHGDSSEMNIWDVNSRTCVHRAIDDGCLSCESIAMSPNGQFVATGSKQGVVNVYETDAILKQHAPKPLKIVLNLVTSITSLKFNPTSEILAMASDKKPNAFKMMHIPSFNIFSNFPTFQTRLNMPEVVEFSPGGGYLGISNRSHSAFLFRLKHYHNY